MEWFEQVKDTVIKTAGVAYEKSEKLVDIAKIKLSKWKIYMKPKL